MVRRTRPQMRQLAHRGMTVMHEWRRLTGDTARLRFVFLEIAIVFGWRRADCAAKPIATIWRYRTMHSKTDTIQSSVEALRYPWENPPAPVGGAGGWPGE